MTEEQKEIQRLKIQIQQMELKHAKELAIKDTIIAKKNLDVKSMERLQSKVRGRLETVMTEKLTLEKDYMILVALKIRDIPEEESGNYEKACQTLQQRLGLLTVQNEELKSQVSNYEKVIGRRKANNNKAIINGVSNTDLEYMHFERCRGQSFQEIGDKFDVVPSTAQRRIKIYRTHIGYEE